MKKLITLILVLSAWNSFAQLTLVKEIEVNKANPILLSNGNIKFYTSNKNFNGSKILSLDLFNDDLSFYKKIEISQTFPFDTTGLEEVWLSLKSIDDISGNNYYFTDNFFNLDNKLEFILSYFGSKTVNGARKYYQVVIIANEEGKEIHRFTNLNTVYEGLGMRFSKYLSVTFNNKTQLYSVPGNFPCPSSCNQKPASISPIDPSNAVNKLSIEGFPNPTSEKITLAYTLPKGSSYGTIRLYSQTGTLVKEFKVTDQFDHLELPVADYAAGTYFYELQVDGNSSGGKKMLVVH
jgi:hypothetical protein